MTQICLALGFPIMHETLTYVIVAKITLIHYQLQQNLKHPTHDTSK